MPGRGQAVIAPAMGASGILIDGLGYELPGRRILSGLSAHLTERRIGVVGRNGSGKTTLLRLIAGLIAPTEGTIEVEGMNPAGDRKAMLVRLGILFQNPDHQIIFPTVLEEIAFGLIQLGHAGPEAERRALALLARHGRAHWAKARVETLSHGQKQVLCLLSVLAMEPATILLDEPFAALDLPMRTRLHRLFDSLPQRLITITHDPATLEEADRVLWLDEGHLLADGPAARILPLFRAEMARIGAADADTDLAH